MSITHSLTALRFNVAGMLKSPTGESRWYQLRIPISDLDQIDESFDVTGPFEGVVHFLKTIDTILVQVEGTTTVHLECARCLELFDRSITIDFEEEFHPSIDIATGRVLADRGDDEALVIDEQHILDLTEVIRQSIILALPTIALCREDCAGLCPECGANLNETFCHCANESVDPRWSALQALIDVSEEQTSTDSIS